MATKSVEVGADEVLVAIKRPEGYEDVHPALVADDAIVHGWPSYRLVELDQSDVCCANPEWEPMPNGEEEICMNCSARRLAQSMEPQL